MQFEDVKPVMNRLTEDLNGFISEHINVLATVEFEQPTCRFIAKSESLCGERINDFDRARCHLHEINQKYQKLLQEIRSEFQVNIKFDLALKPLENGQKIYKLNLGLVCELF